MKKLGHFSDGIMSMLILQIPQEPGQGFTYCRKGKQFYIRVEDDDYGDYNERIPFN